jgi:plastocyanin
MRRTALIFISLLIFASNAFAKDEYVSIAGTVNNFRTDVRLLNPSFDKDIVVHATFLPIGNADNTSRTSVDINVPKRQMKILDDVVAAVFSTTGLGGIRFSSDDDFEVTSRIYATVATGTLGQFSPGLTPDLAKTKGALLQLKSNATFRSNLGAVNPNNSAATVTWRLYDKNNAIVATGTPVVMPPFAVIGPTNMASGFFFNPGTADLSDAWVSYTSDKPIFAYSSVIDNSTTDPTFIPAVNDSGVPPSTTPQSKTFEVQLSSFQITFTPAASFSVGDQVTLNIHCEDLNHGFQLNAPDGTPVVPGVILSPGKSVTKTFTVTAEGQYVYFCANPVCGSGHSNMVGSVQVGSGGDDPGRGY